MATSNSDFVFAVYDSAGAPLAGLSPTWTVYKEVIGGTTPAESARPAITDVGGGLYSVPLVSEVGARYSGIIDFGATANPRYQTYDSPGPSAENPTPTPVSGATTLTLAQLILQVRQRADMENSQFVTDAEVTSYINHSLFELYDLLVQKFGDDYFASYTTVATDGTNDQFALPSTLYKILGVDLAIDGTDRYLTLRPFVMGERNRWVFPNTLTTTGILSNLRYKVMGSNIWFSPKPAAGQTVRVWFIPRMVPLADLTDRADGVSGWLEYVVVDAAIKCLQKEESDPSVLMAQKVALIDRIESAARNRDAGQPLRVTDVASQEWPLGYGFGWHGW